MLKRFAKLSMPLIALAGFAFLATPKANAAPTLTLKADVTSGTAATLTVLDNTTPPDLDPTIGNLVLSTSTTPLPFGDFQVFGSRSTSNAQAPNGPPGAVATLSSGALAVTNPTNTAQTIDLRISDINYMGPPSPLFLVATASGTFRPDDNNTSVFGSSAHALAWADNTNTLFGHQQLIQDFTFTAANTPLGQSYSNTQSFNGFTYTGKYSLTVELIFTVAAHSSLVTRTDLIQAISTVPEPATMASLGLGVVAAMGFGLRRRFTA